MSESLKKIQEYILYQEQWTKATDFSTSGFEEINAILITMEEKEQEEIQEFCEQQLKKNRNGVYALYINGLFTIEENTLNDKLLIKLIDLFIDNHKWSVVEYLAKKILEYRNNLRALKRLAIVYEESNTQEKLLPIWEQIVRIDYEEADMLMKLAKYKLSHNDTDSAIKDYKKAIYRYLQQKIYPPIREIWIILISHNPLDTDFYSTCISKMERILSPGRSIELLELLYNKLETTKAFDTTISILKNLLRLEPQNVTHRNNLIDIYTKRYKDNPKLDDFIRMSNISQTWRNIHEAISDFEKHISFFPGSFVYHNKWGIGRIQEANHQYLIIDFSTKRQHQMEISMAVNSLESLPKDHFWVLRTITPKEQLRTQILKKPIWALRRILISLGGADVKTIKNELVPAIISATEWNSWSVKARKILQTNPYFGVLPEKSDLYIFSETPISPIDKFYGIFRMEDSFLAKIKLMRKAIESKVFEDISNNEDIFLNILDYFNSHVNRANSEEKYTEQFINSLFVCDEILHALPAAEYHIHVYLKEFIPQRSIDEIKLLIKKLRINHYKDMLFSYVKEYRKDWKDIYLQILPYYHTNDIVSLLEKEQEQNFLKKVYTHIQNNASDFRNAFIWFTTHMYEKPWLKEVIDDFKVCSDLIRIAILLFRDIQNKYQVPVNKRLLANIESFLFESGRVDIFLREKDHKSIMYLYSLINQISDVIPNRILDLRDTILKYHPNFNFRDQFEFEQAGSTGFLTLSRSYEKKKKQLQHIHEIEVPNNSKEIETARAFGDLKENAEYKAALEHQEALNNRVAQIKKEIEQARIFDEDTFSTNSAGFATCIELIDHSDNTNKKYTLLGPWESSPENNIISYLSPLGKTLYKKKLNEKFTYTLNNKEHTVSISNISKGI